MMNEPITMRALRGQYDRLADPLMDDVFLLENRQAEIMKAVWHPMQTVAQACQAEKLLKQWKQRRANAA